MGDEGLQCLVVGRWAEGSQHLHNLVQKLAEARALHQERTTGVPSTAGNLAVIIGRYRRILSCTFVRALETCLLDRLGHMDAGAREAALRRQTTVREEERDRLEASAYFQEYDTYAIRTFATPYFVTSATPLFVTSATPIFRTIATRTYATPKIYF